jgi:hypothetical protein
MKTISDQIKDLENTRAAKAARMETIMKASVEAGRTTDDAEAEEFDTLEGEIATLDKDLVRLKKLEAMNGQRAAPVVIREGDPTPVKSGSAARGASGPMIVMKTTDKEDAFKGQSYTRMVIAKALAHILGGGASPSAIAQHRWGKTNPTLVALIKANEVAGGGSGSGEWGAELVQADTRYTGDFVEFLYSQTVFDKLPLREVPANVAIKGQDGQATGYWVGESKSIPASKADFSTVNLTRLKVGALAVISNELIKDSTPAAEALVQSALVNASAQRVDTTFLSATAASAGVAPAGMLNGVSGIGSAGPDGNGLRADIKALYAPFIAAKNATGLQYVMNPALAKAIQLLTNALGLYEFATVNTGGGTLLGDPVTTGDNVDAAQLILLKPSDIWKIGDTGVEVSISRDAMIEQSSAPTGATDTPVAASQVFTSMFQEESTAIKVVRPINFAKRRSSAVAYISDADYGDITSP